MAAVETRPCGVTKSPVGVLSPILDVDVSPSGCLSLCVDALPDASAKAPIVAESLPDAMGSLLISVEVPLGVEVSIPHDLNNSSRELFNQPLFIVGVVAAYTELMSNTKI